MHTDVFFFNHSCIQSEQLNAQQMAIMFQNSVLDAGFVARELSHKSKRSMPASFIKYNAPSDSWTCAVM